MKAKDIMSTPVVTAKPDTALKRIAETLVEHDISAVPIVDDDGELVGLVSEADVVRLQTVPDPRRHLIPALAPRSVVPRYAADVMSINIVTATEDTDVTDIARMMWTLRLRRIPVVDGNRVIGMITRRDILKVLARSDISIQAELQGLLEEEEMILGSFVSRVADGVVTLTGPEDKDARRLARLLARSIPGVVAVRFDDDP